MQVILSLSPPPNISPSGTLAWVKKILVPLNPVQKKSLLTLKKERKTLPP